MWELSDDRADTCPLWVSGSPCRDFVDEDGGLVVFFFQAEDGIRDYKVTGVQTCALPILPPFARPLPRLSRRPFSQWLMAWLGREALALPIWIWAFWGGVTVVWRDRKF